MNIIFFGTSDYCLPILESLNKNFKLKLVVTRPDKPVGRKGVLTPSATKLWAIENKIPFTTPETLKADTTDRLKFMDEIKAISPDLAIVSDYGLIIPEPIFNFPKLGTLNVHFSKLPELRGPSPVQFTLLRGSKEAWITIFKLESPKELKIKMDSGEILWQQNFPILSEDTTSSLYGRLFEEAGKSIPKLVTDYEVGGIKLIKQNHNNATFCRFLTKEDGFIEWSTLKKVMDGNKLSFEELPTIQKEALKTSSNLNSSDYPFILHNFYKAVTPWPGMWTLKEGKRMKILKCHIEADKLLIDSVQFEGKLPQSYLG